MRTSIERLAIAAERNTALLRRTAEAAERAADAQEALLAELRGRASLQGPVLCCWWCAVARHVLETLEKADDGIALLLAPEVDLLQRRQRLRGLWQLCIVLAWHFPAVDVLVEHQLACLQGNVVESSTG